MGDKVKSPIYPLFVLAVSLAVSACGLVWANSLWILVPLGILLLAMCFFASPFKVLTLVLFFALTGGIFFGLIYVVTGSTDAAMESLTRCFALACGGAPLLCLSPADMCRTLDTLRCQRGITLPILVTLSFIPALFKERRMLKKAYKVKGSKMFEKPFFLASLPSFIVRISEFSDEMALGLETRGFKLGNPPSKLYEPRYPKAKDWVFLALGICILVSLIGVGIWVG